MDGEKKHSVVRGFCLFAPFQSVKRSSNAAADERQDQIDDEEEKSRGVIKEKHGHKKHRANHKGNPKLEAIFSAEEHRANQGKNSVYNP